LPNRHSARTARRPEDSRTSDKHVRTTDDHIARSEAMATDAVVPNNGRRRCLARHGRERVCSSRRRAAARDRRAP
jgi:hypothetical protein